MQPAQRTSRVVPSALAWLRHDGVQSVPQSEACGSVQIDGPLVDSAIADGFISGVDVSLIIGSLSLGAPDCDFDAVVDIICERLAEIVAADSAVSLERGSRCDRA